MPKGLWVQIPPETPPSGHGIKSAQHVQVAQTWQTRQTQTLVFKGSTPFLGTINKSAQQNIVVRIRRGTATPYADGTVKDVCAADLLHIGT